MDPIADKLLVIAALVSLVSLDRLAAWVAMVIITRELAVTVARAQAPDVIPAGGLGKLKTVVQVAAIFFLILLDPAPADRKSTSLNSSHANISYAVFCL